MWQRACELAAALLLVCLGACDVGMEPALQEPATTRSAVSSLEEEEGRLLVATSRRRFAEVATRVRSLGGSVELQIPEIDVLVVAGLDDVATESLRKHSGVAAVEPEVLLTVGQPSAPGQTVEGDDDAGVIGHDPTSAGLFGLQWNMQAIAAPPAWAAGHDATGVRVAIIDTGVDPFHQDLVGRVDATRSRAFVASLNAAGPAWGDDNLHGTHVAGIVSTNGIGVAGVAPHATLIAIKICNVLGACPTGTVMAGIVHAANVGAHVANLSVRGLGPKAATPGIRGMLNRATTYAHRQGVILVAGAGNDALDLQHTPNVHVTPCGDAVVTCVSATGGADEPAFYSNFGRPWIDLAAPGGALTANVAASTILSTCSSLSLLIGCGTGSYLFLQGTSMASPHVAGAAAMFIAATGSHPAGTASSLGGSADDLGKPGVDPFYGKGRLNLARLLGVN